VLCTNDNELAEAAQDEQTPLVVLRDLSALWRWHGTTQPADDELANAIRRWLTESFEGEDVDRAVSVLAIDPMALGRIDHHRLRVAADLGRRDDHYQLEVQLRRLDAVWITDVEVVDGGELPHIILATMAAVGAVAVDDWFFNEDGELEHEQGETPAQVSAAIVAAFDERWSMIDVEVAEAAQVRPLEEQEFHSVVDGAAFDDRRRLS